MHASPLPLKLGRIKGVVGVVVPSVDLPKVPLDESVSQLVKEIDNELFVSPSRDEEDEDES